MYDWEFSKPIERGDYFKINDMLSLKDFKLKSISNSKNIIGGHLVPTLKTTNRAGWSPIYGIVTWTTTDNDTMEHDADVKNT